MGTANILLIFENFKALSLYAHLTSVLVFGNVL